MNHNWPCSQHVLGLDLFLHVEERQQVIDVILEYHIDRDLMRSVIEQEQQWQ